MRIEISCSVRNLAFEVADEEGVSMLEGHNNRWRDEAGRGKHACSIETSQGLAAIAIYLGKLLFNCAHTHGVTALAFFALD